MKLPFYNTFTRQDDFWNPDNSGVFFVAFRNECNGILKNGSRVMLGNDAQHTYDKAIVSLAMIICRYPELKDELIVVHAPCLFSNRKSWIEKGEPKDIPIDVTNFISTQHDIYSCSTQHRIKQKYKLSTTFM